MMKSVVLQALVFRGPFNASSSSVSFVLALISQASDSLSAAPYPAASTAFMTSLDASAYKPR